MSFGSALWWFLCLIGLGAIWWKKLPIPVGKKRGELQFVRHSDSPRKWYAIILVLLLLILLLAGLDQLLYWK
jgi:hypothetical protein